LHCDLFFLGKLYLPLFFISTLYVQYIQVCFGSSWAGPGIGVDGSELPRCK
jgi:hypothetical protein